MGRRAVTSLSIVLSGDEPPSEFRVFAAGPNETTKGTFTFDEASAASVMAEYEAHGIDLMVDYDHASVAGLSLDPAQAGKAAAWFNLEVRNAELWAVNVRWTPPAAEALRRKEWRFMSPALHADDSGRVLSLINVAVTNLPATRRLEPLMAASIKTLGDKGMTLEEMMKVAEALDLGPDATIDDFLAKIGAMKDGEKKPEDKPADKPAELGLTEEEKPEEVAAALSAVRSLSGKPSFVASIADIRTWHASHVELAAERKKLADREAVLEGAERRKLCVELVTLAGRAPATVWATPDSQEPKAYLASMPIGDLRAMHADAVKAHGGKPASIQPPNGGGRSTDGSKSVTLDDGSVVSLSARVVAMCAEKKIDLKVYAASLPKKKG